MRPDSRKFTDAITMGLLCLAFVTLVIGGAVPLAARLGNPFLAYAIVFVSFPAWAFGGMAAGLAAFRASRRETAERMVMLWGLALCASNILAALAVLLVPFHAS